MISDWKFRDTHRITLGKRRLLQDLQYSLFDGESNTYHHYYHRHRNPYQPKRSRTTATTENCKSSSHRVLKHQNQIKMNDCTTTQSLNSASKHMVIQHWIGVLVNRLKGMLLCLKNFNWGMLHPRQSSSFLPCQWRKGTTSQIPSC